MAKAPTKTQINFRVEEAVKWRWAEEAAKRRMREREFIIAAVEFYAKIDPERLHDVKSYVAELGRGKPKTRR